MSESTDFASVPGEAIGNLVSSAARLEDDIHQQESHTGKEPVPVKVDEEEEEEVPIEFLKPYYCGCGPCHPSWLQFFAHKKCFTLLLCFFSFVQGSLVSG